MIGDNDAHDGTNGGWFDNRAEGVIEVKIGLLGKSLNNKTTFLVVKITTRVKLMTIKPTSSNYVGTRGRRNDNTNVVGVESNHFRIHG